MLPNKITLELVESININPARQRTKLNPEHIQRLALDIAERGLITPIIVNEIESDGESRLELVAGQNRLEAFKQISEWTLEGELAKRYRGWTCIPTIKGKNLTIEDAHAIELIENIHRESLHWKDEVLAVYNYHIKAKAKSPEWTGSDTAKALTLQVMRVSQILMVAPELLANNEKVHACSALFPAYQLLQKRMQRELANDLESLMAIPDPAAAPKPNPAGAENFTKQTGDAAVDAVRENAPIENTAQIQLNGTAQNYNVHSEHQSAIINADCIKWLEEYSGERFNFLHCDFPYGINHQKSAQGSAGKYGAYDDSEETYWNLLNALAANKDKILRPSCHIMFWFSMKFYDETLEFFANKMQDFVCQPFPMIWHRSDNSGILPDAQRYGRRTYETAFLLTRADRKILTPVALSYAGPTSKKIHATEKPEPMLRHFFRMFIDEHSYMLDLTCGSGSSVRAAESLKAKFSLGLELDPEITKLAQDELKVARIRNAHAEV